MLISTVSISAGRIAAPGRAEFHPATCAYPTITHNASDGTNPTTAAALTVSTGDTIVVFGYAAGASGHSTSMTISDGGDSFTLVAWSAIAPGAKVANTSVWTATAGITGTRTIAVSNTFYFVAANALDIPTVSGYTIRSGSPGDEVGPKPSGMVQMNVTTGYCATAVAFYGDLFNTTSALVMTGAAGWTGVDGAAFGGGSISTGAFRHANSLNSNLFTNLSGGNGQPGMGVMISYGTNVVPSLPPAAPTGLSFSNVTDVGFDATWSNPSGSLTFINVTYGTTCGALTIGGSSVRTTQAFTGLTPSTTYCVGVSAANVNGTSPFAFGNITTLAHATGPGPSVVAYAHVGGTFSGGSANLTVPSIAVASGNAMIVLVNWHGDAYPSPAVSDGRGDIFTLIGEQGWMIGTPEADLIIYAAFDLTSGSVSINVVINPSYRVGTLQVTVVEITNVANGFDTSKEALVRTITLPTTTNLDLILMAYGDDGDNTQGFTAEPPSTMVSNLFTPAGGAGTSRLNEVVAALSTGLSSATGYTMQLNKTNFTASNVGVIAISFSPPGPANVLSVGNAVQGSGTSVSALTLPVIEISGNSGICAIVGWPTGNNGLDVSSISGGPNLTKQKLKGGDTTGNALEIWTGNAVLSGNYTFTIHLNGSVAEVWASVVEVTSTYSGGAAFDAIGLGEIGPAPELGDNAGVYYQEDQIASSSVGDLYLLAGATATPSPHAFYAGAENIGTRAILESASLSPTSFVVRASSTYHASTDTIGYAMINSGANATGLSVSFKALGTPDPLGANAGAIPTFGGAPLTVAISSTATGGVPPYSYAWTFGDGGTSTVQNPSYTYMTAGTYVAEVTVTDANPSTVRANVTISVSPSVPPSLTITNVTLTSFEESWSNGTWTNVTGAVLVMGNTSGYCLSGLGPEWNWSVATLATSWIPQTNGIVTYGFNVTTMTNQSFLPGSTIWVGLVASPETQPTSCHQITFLSPSPPAPQLDIWPFIVITIIAGLILISATQRKKNREWWG
jgi:PKD repeat protein